MTTQAFEDVNIYVLLFKTRYLKPVATRHQLQGTIVYCHCLNLARLYLLDRFVTIRQILFSWSSYTTKPKITEPCRDLQ